MSGSSAPAVSTSKGELRTKATAFAARFADARSEQAERQTFWNEFFGIFGVDRRQVATFELLAKRASTGNIGWIDLLFPGQMGVEHKSFGEDLDAAMTQLIDYLPYLPGAEWPWLLVACDFRTFEWRNLEEGTEGKFALEELPDNLDLFFWLAGYERPHVRFENEAEANLAATDLLAVLHDRLGDNGFSGHPLREWMTRILFCLFADDTGVWDRAAFHAWVAAHTRPDGTDLGPQLAYLFQLLDTAVDDRPGNLDEELSQFTYINGDLFDETLPIPSCDAQVRDALLKACAFDWAAISPAIFGSMFQNVMDAPERRQLGAHYTSEENILRTIRPLFLDELESQLEAATTRPKLEAFLERLAHLKFFDPACGCGNFLVIAYREIRRLETEALRRLAEKQGRTGQLEVDITLRCKVQVDQFYGIEIEEFPAKIARTALYLMDHLANRAVSAEFGQHFVRFPIPAAPHIEHANALRMDWEALLPASEAVYVFGNPPFLGRQFRTADQKADLAVAHEDARGHAVLDLVTGWFVKAARYLEGTKGRAAFVATSSISQGENVSVLWPALLERGLSIDFAYRPFKWTSEARGKAHVYVVIIGFSYLGPKVRTLIDVTAGTSVDAKNISPYLTNAPTVVVHKRRDVLGHGLPETVYGSMANDDGGLLIEEDEIANFRNDPVARKFLRPYVGAQEMLYDISRWCLWLEGVPAAELRRSSLIMERLRLVKEYREASNRATTKKAAATPALFLERRPIAQRFLLAPFVSTETRSYIPFEFYEPPTITAAPAWCVPGADEYLFGVLSSAMFNTWAQAVAGRMGNGLRLSPGTVYNTFPLPAATDTQRAAAVKAAKRVLALRKRHRAAGSTLADLFDPLTTPPDLVRAHQDLDKAVDGVVAPRRRFSSDADRLAALLDRYQAATSTGQLEIA